MLTPLTYGTLANGPTSSAPSSYYWFGIGGAAGTKFRANGTATVEAGFLSGLASTVFGSNLPARTNAYYGFAPSRTNRFTTASALFANFVGIYKRLAVFPVFAGWQVFGSPTNAT
jgi:hypothetical protein